MKNFLFDLDGTLLPMNQKKFVEYYMPLLAARFRGRGVSQERLIGAVWKGVEAMVRNDGKRTNEEAFWKCFEQLLSIRREDMEEEVLDFYGKEFNEAVKATVPSVYANRIIKYLKKEGRKVYLATNPIFPRCATMNRIRWAGLDAKDFEEITTYEDYHYSKPNPKYFEEILVRCNLKAEECIMIGNDVMEDLTAATLGIKTCLVTECLEHGEIGSKADYQSESLKQLYEDIQKGCY